MDFNLVVLTGRLAAEPEVRTFASGSTLIRYLVTVRTTGPRRRVDVVPVTLWDPSDSLLGVKDAKGRRVFVAGAVQRRFWTADGGKASRVEVVAHEVQFKEEADVPEDDEGRASA